MKKRTQRIGYRYVTLRLPNQVIKNITDCARDNKETKSVIIAAAIDYFIRQGSILYKSRGQERIRKLAEQEMIGFIEKNGGVEKFQGLPPALVPLRDNSPRTDYSLDANGIHEIKRTDSLTDDLKRSFKNYLEMLTAK